MRTCPVCQTGWPDDVLACGNDGEMLPDPDLEVGATVGDYRIDGKLGAGAFGAVFRATHPLIGKRVAIKVLSSEYSASKDIVSRFVAEAQVVNQIGHKNIIDIFAFGQLADGRHYYVMDLLSGVTLDEYLRQRGRLTVAQASPVLRGVARALDAAHRQGVAHRDLKPANVFIADDDGEPFPKLLDFGIAKLMRMGSGTASASHRTRTGTPMGTPQYMSPEQCRGRDVDHRTDIYSFGVMTYELVTGKRPFSGQDYLEIINKQVSEEPRPAWELVPELPHAVHDAIAWMMAKDPAARPATVAAAVEALDAAAGIAALPASGSAKQMMGGTGLASASTLPAASAPIVSATAKTAATATPGSGTVPPSMVAAEIAGVTAAGSRPKRGAWIAVGAVIVAGAVVAIAMASGGGGGGGGGGGATQPVSQPTQPMPAQPVAPVEVTATPPVATGSAATAPVAHPVTSTSTLPSPSRSTPTTTTTPTKSKTTATEGSPTTIGKGSAGSAAPAGGKLPEF